MGGVLRSEVGGRKQNAALESVPRWTVGAGACFNGEWWQHWQRGAAMADSFDAYHKWLGIPPAEQPPHHYRLLGLSLYESDPDVIEIAADQRMALLRSFHAGPHSDLTQKLLNEVAAARLTLLRPDRRTSYNDILRRRLEKAQPREQPAKQPPSPDADQASDKLTNYYEQLRQHVEHETPRPDTADLLETLVPIEPPPIVPVEPVKPVRPINPAPLAAPVAAPPKFAATVPSAAPSVHRDRDLGPAPKPEVKPTSRIDSSRTIALPPRTAAWDQAIEEACAAETALSRPRRRWHVSGLFVQLVLGVCIIGGLLYGAIKGFTVWQVAEASKGLGPKRDVRPPLSPPDVKTDVAAIDMQPAHTEPVEPAHPDPALSQPVPSEPNDPSLNDARSVAGGFGLSNTPTPAPAPATAPSSSGEPQPPPVVRSPVPTGEALRKSAEAVSGEIKTEIRRINSAGDQRELAHKLAERATQTSDDPAKRYALAHRALELAIKLCDVHLASDLVGGLSTFYSQNSWALRGNTLQRLAQSAPNRETREIIAEAALNLVEPALADDDYDSAQKLATLSMNLATALRNIPLRDQARELIDRLKQIQLWLTPVKDAKYQLAADPANADANLIIGEFKSLMKRDWPGGLVNLRAANDKQLGALVEREQTPPTQAVEQAELADAWWNLAESRQDPNELLAFKALHARAVYWYRQALPNLTGDALVNAKKRTETP
jgi:hypothetical protein